MWKDVLNNKWYGPDPVISRSRGAICVFPQNREDPIWVPARLTREVKDAAKDEDDPVDAECPTVDDSCGNSKDDPLGVDKGMAHTDTSSC